MTFALFLSVASSGIGLIAKVPWLTDRTRYLPHIHINLLITKQIVLVLSPGQLWWRQRPRYLYRKHRQNGGEITNNSAVHRDSQQTTRSGENRGDSSPADVKFQALIKSLLDNGLCVKDALHGASPLILAHGRVSAVLYTVKNRAFNLRFLFGPGRSVRCQFRAAFVSAVEIVFIPKWANFQLMRAGMRRPPRNVANI